MKKLFTLAALFFVVAISSSALAANWVKIYSYEGSYSTFVDKDSIKYGINSHYFPRFSRSDGFSINVKRTGGGYDYFPEGKRIILLGFWTENGKVYFAGLDEIDENGVPISDSPRNTDPRGKDGENIPIWELGNDPEDNAIYDYIQNNLP